MSAASDTAFEKWFYRSGLTSGEKTAARSAWKECRRRMEDQIAAAPELARDFMNLLCASSEADQQFARVAAWQTLRKAGLLPEGE